MLEGIITHPPAYFSFKMHFVSIYIFHQSLIRASLDVGEDIEVTVTWSRARTIHPAMYTACVGS